jgi:hypothetical protein
MGCAIGCVAGAKSTQAANAMIALQYMGISDRLEAVL